jgi:Zn-dependent protease with chaperone function
MSPHRPCQALTAVLLCCALAGPAAAASRKGDVQLVEQVSRHLLAVTPAVEGLEWPPKIEIRAAGTGDEINAFAQVEKGNDGKLRPRVVVTPGMMHKVIRGDRDRLAFILGHELGHIVRRHVQGRPQKTPFLRVTFTRKQEAEADRKGLELALKAGYSWKRGMKAIERMIDMGLEYSSFEGLGADHPSWKERLALLDKDQAPLWKAMSAFNNGVVFLSVEQYAAAERCFDRVTKEFPACPEAWANLGYACLMQYCDAMEPVDLRHFGVGQIVCGGFYQRPASLEARVRGIDEELWWKAVGALRESLRLSPGQVLVNANLGLAYLVRPAGKDTRRAEEFFQAAVDRAARDQTLDPVVHAVLFINGGVADLAGQRQEDAARKFERCEALGSGTAGGAGTLSRRNPTLAAALLYNRALLQAASARKTKQRAAVALFEKYLKTANPTSAWWPLAYEQYAKLCQDLGLAAKAERAFKSGNPDRLRLTASVSVSSGVLVALADPAREVADRLGRPEEVPVIAGTNLRRWRYPKHGLELLVTDQVLAICLTGPGAPPLPLRGEGLAARAKRLRVGLSKAELEDVLADQDYGFAELVMPDVYYRFYRDLGLAVRVEKGKLKELVVVQIPRQ